MKHGHMFAGRIPTSVTASLDQLFFDIEMSMCLKITDKIKDFHQNPIIDGSSLVF